MCSLLVFPAPEPPARSRRRRTAAAWRCPRRSPFCCVLVAYMLSSLISVLYHVVCGLFVCIVVVFAYLLVFVCCCLLAWRCPRRSPAPSKASNEIEISL